MAIAYRFLCAFAAPRPAQWALAVCLPYVVMASGRFYSYNWLTGLMFTAAALALQQGLFERRSCKTLLAGALVGASILARLPNVAGLGLAGVIPVAGWITSPARLNTA